MSIKRPAEARAVVGMKGLEDFISRKRKTLLLRYKNSSTDTSRLDRTEAVGVR